MSSIFLNNDTNLLDLDYLVVADARLKSQNFTSELDKTLSNWTVLGRFDSNDEMIHMGLLFLKSHKSHQQDIVHNIKEKQYFKQHGTLGRTLSRLA